MLLRQQTKSDDRQCQIYGFMSHIEEIAPLKHKPHRLRIETERLTFKKVALSDPAGQILQAVLERH